MAFSYSTTISTNSARDGAVLMRKFNELRAGSRAIATDQINFLTETNGPLNMDAVAGHYHNGTDGKALASATDTRVGGVKVSQVTNNHEWMTWGTSAPSAIDYNASTGIVTVLAVFMGVWDPALGIPTPPITGYPYNLQRQHTWFQMTNYYGGSFPTVESCCVAIDPVASPNKVYFWAPYGHTTVTTHGMVTLTIMGI